MTDIDLIELEHKSTAMFSAKVLADSVNPCGDRLTTFEIVMPRMLLPELNTHRAFSRNTASSRAIPLSKTIEVVKETPFIPFHWGKNQSGMQAYEELDDKQKARARWHWWSASREAYYAAQSMAECDLHKQVANRVLEPFLFSTIILSCTSFSHFENLRTNAAAEPHFQHVANLMVSARSQSLPEALKPGEWHLPLIYEEDRSRLNLDDLKKVCTARCAAVSYVRHNEVKDYEKDFALYDRLAEGKHLSPMEHLATPFGYYSEAEYGAEGWSWNQGPWESRDCGNFKGWKQHRKEMEGEFIPDEPYDGPTR